MSTTIRRSFTLPVGPKEAFALLADGRKIRSWSGQKGGVQPRIGGRFSMFDGWVAGVVLAYQPGKALAYTWLPQDWNAGTEPSIVSYSFRGSGRKTQVRLVHKLLPNASTARDHASGWTEHVIDPLKAYLTTQDTA